MAIGLQRTVAPAILPVTLAETKAHIRVDLDDDDALIGGLIDQAVAEIDGAAGLLGRALIKQTWQARLRTWPTGPLAAVLRVPLPPLIAVGAITYLDGDGASQTVDAGSYVVVTEVQPGEVWLAKGKSWPANTLDTGRPVITVTFDAGFGEAAADVPEPVRRWIMNRVGLLYSNRELPPAPKLGSLVNWRMGTFGR